MKLGKNLSINYCDQHFVVKFRYIDEERPANAPIIMKKKKVLFCNSDDFLIFIKEYQLQMKGRRTT